MENCISFYLDKCRCCLKEIDAAAASEIDENIAGQITYVSNVEVKH